MCDYLPFKIVDKKFFINMTNNNNKLYAENKTLIKKNNQLNNSNQKLNNELFQVKKDNLDTQYIIEKNNNHIKCLNYIINYLTHKLYKNINEDEINEINQYIYNLLG